MGDIVFNCSIWFCKLYEELPNIPTEVYTTVFTSSFMLHSTELLTRDRHDLNNEHDRARIGYTITQDAMGVQKQHAKIDKERTY